MMCHFIFIFMTIRNNTTIQVQRDDSTSKGNIIFYTNGGSGVTQRMNTESDAKVGIGSSSPTGHLDVMGGSDMPTSQPHLQH